jgi:hypothetical protein
METITAVKRLTEQAPGLKFTKMYTNFDMILV